MSRLFQNHNINGEQSKPKPDLPAATQPDVLPVLTPHENQPDLAVATQPDVFPVSTPCLSSPPAGVRPLNFYSVTKEESIKEQIVLDPSLRVSPSLLMPLEPGETERKNLKLVSLGLSRYSNIDADIYLLDGEDRVPSGLSTNGSELPAPLRTAMYIAGGPGLCQASNL